MPRKPPHRPFTPQPAQLALRPKTSGNEINGLNETAQRQPRLVYWAPDPDDIPHGEMQRWFYSVNPDHPALIAARQDRQKVLDTPLADLAASQVNRSPEDWTERLARFVDESTCEKVGVAEMDPAWAYEGEQVTQSKVIMIAVKHDYEALSQAPAPEAGAEVVRQYGRAAAAAKTIASWLRAHRVGKPTLSPGR
ncbi:hypothetical protein WNY61_08175 [Sulfitobacter sp. AS92]|uniref:hypothetical protein n=1 Tax=Sulfitobacter sp. AS92 TaxID=3135783 RepID=UPI00316EA6F5